MVRNKAQELFEIKNPRAAAFLAYCPLDNVPLVYTKYQEENLKVVTKRGEYLLHDAHGAQDEANQWVKTLPLQAAEWIVVFGVGLGWHLEAFLPWLSENSARHLVVLEDDLSVTARFLASERAQQITQHPQITFSFYEEGEEGLTLVKKLAWALHKRTYYFTVLPAYQCNRPKRCKSLQELLSVKVADVHMVLDEYCSYGISCFHNLWNSYFKRWGSALSQNSFIGQFKGKSALVIGAGPSLEAQMHTIKNLSDKLLIVAGGSSLPACAGAGLEPHIAAGVDPNPPQYMRLRQAETIACPFFFSGRMLDEAVEQVQGPLIYCRVEEGFGLAQWLEKQVGITGPRFDAGHGVVNLLIELAYHLGCRRIGLVGIDLCYNDKKLYPESIASALGKDESVDIVDTTLLLEAEGVNGTVLTEPKWLVEAAWISQFKARHPRLEIVNLSPNGLKIEGVPQGSLESFAADLEVDDIAGRVAYCTLTAGHAVKDSKNTPNNIPKDTSKKIPKAAQKLKKSIQSSKVVVAQLLQLCEHEKQGVPLHESIEVRELFQKLQAEDAYSAFLQDFVLMQDMLTRSLEYFILPATVSEENQIVFRNERFIETVYFLDKCLEVQERMIDHFGELFHE